MKFGIRVSPITQTSYDDVAGKTGNIKRGVQIDGEFLLYHPGELQSVLLIEDEVVVDGSGRFIAAKCVCRTNSSFYLADNYSG